uniref:aromatic ring-hydroxylating oxygenase subunit alpha n=1 Tax=uncultured Caulobacter sp. TaxID=158749 RepID=UPI002600C6E9|nr:aromatic ring-hydroxylating dioxygenase subunit alpha [uncultured Caulobacter sp.]
MTAISNEDSQAADPLENWGLPGWIYGNERFFREEQDRIFRPSWQIVCHLNDIPKAGDFHTFDFVGESLVVVRGKDGGARAFANVCRHRGARLLDGPVGRCNRRIVCPYHAWTYDLEGRLIGVPMRDDYPALDMAKEGLTRIETEIWRGFVFVRIAKHQEGGEGPSVATMMAPYEDEVAHYRFEELQPFGRVTLRPREVNWKNISDNYSDGLHIPVAHPGLTRLFGKGYGVEAKTFVDKMWGQLIDEPSESPSERLYQDLLPDVPHLPGDRKRLWTYFKLWPNFAFDIYPDQVDFMQFIPVSAGKTMIREIAYALPDERREMKAARYLNWRINRQVNAEDTELVARVQQGMASRTFTAGPLATSEVSLRSFGRKMRALVPESRLERPPEGW